MTTPKVSVILPVYNDEEFIEEAIESILNQSYSNFDLYIVNDGSTDGTSQIISNYSTNQRVEIIEHERNRGLPTALNTAICKTDSPLIARQDADDRSLPDRLQSQVEYLVNNPDVSVVGTATHAIDENGEIKYTQPMPSDPTEWISEQNPIVHGTVMMRREPIESVGGYDEFFKYCQDYDLFARLVENGYVLGGINEILYQNRKQIKSIESRRVAKLYSIIIRSRLNGQEHIFEKAKQQGIEGIQSEFPVGLQAEYYRLLSRASIQEGDQTGAFANAIRAIKADPAKLEAMFLLVTSLLPAGIGRPILNAVRDAYVSWKFEYGNRLSAD